MKNWKKVLAVSMAAMVMAGALAGCGDDKKSGSAKPAAGQTLKINFPTAGNAIQLSVLHKHTL